MSMTVKNEPFEAKLNTINAALDKGDLLTKELKTVHKGGFKWVLLVIKNTLCKIFCCSKDPWCSFRMNNVVEGLSAYFSNNSENLKNPGQLSIAKDILNKLQVKADQSKSKAIYIQAIDKCRSQLENNATSTTQTRTDIQPSTSNTDAAIETPRLTNPNTTNTSQPATDNSALAQPKDTAPANVTKNENAPLEEARSQFFAWCTYEEDDKRPNMKNFGKTEEYHKFAEELTKQSQPCPRHEMKLYFQYFRFGFRFYYGEVTGQKELVPIPFTEGHILRIAKEENVNLAWPIKNHNGPYFVPTVSEYKELSPPSGSMPTGEYLVNLIRNAQYGRESRDFHILKALLPYSKLVEESVGASYYASLRAMIPDYPEKP